MAKKKAKKTGRAGPKKDKRPARKKAPKKKGTKKASSRAKKKPKAKKRTKKATKKTAKKSTKRKTSTRRGKPASKTTRAKAKKEKRPIRWRYDDDGNVVGFYVPLKHRTKAEQKKASKKMVAACSAGAYRQGVGPKRTCGHRGLAPSSRAGRGLAYARWGFPSGFMRNPAKTYSVKGLLVRTFKDEDGDWGFAVMMPDGTILAGGTEEPSEKVAAREGKAEALYQAALLEEEGRTMRNPAWSQKMPKLSKAEGIQLSVSQDLKWALGELGEGHQRAAINAAHSAKTKLKGLRGAAAKDLRERADRIIRMGQLPADALSLYFEMVRSKGQKLRVSKARASEAHVLVSKGFAKSTSTPAGTKYITVPWASNPQRRKKNTSRKKNPKSTSGVSMRSIMAKALK